MQVFVFPEEVFHASMVSEGVSPLRVLGCSLVDHIGTVAKRFGLEPVSSLPQTDEHVLVVDPDVVITQETLQSMVAEASTPRGIIASSDGGIALVPSGIAATANSVANVLSDSQGLAVRTVEAPVLRVTRNSQSQAANLLLRDSCKRLAPGDYFGVLNRELTLPLTRWIAPTGLSPNAISVIGFVFVVVATVPLATGTYLSFLLGAFLQWIGSLLDGVDGKIARLHQKQSPFGCWLDTILDYVYYLLLFGSIAIGVSRAHPQLALGLGVGAVVGAAVAVMVLVGMRRRLAPPDHPEVFGANMYSFLRRHKGDVVFGFANRTIRLATRAALPHIILVAALVGALPIILAIAAVGTHVVWLIALRVDRVARAELLESPSSLS